MNKPSNNLPNPLIRNHSTGMATRLGQAPRTPKPQTPNPVPTHKFLKRLSTKDMTASFRSMGGDTDELGSVGSEDSHWEFHGSSSHDDEHNIDDELQSESRDMFDSMVHHQYMNVSGSDPFGQTKKEALIDNDGFPLMPSSPSPSHSPIKKKQQLATTDHDFDKKEDEGEGDEEEEEKEEEKEDALLVKQSKLNDSIERYIIPCREDIKPAREVGKTIGIPYVGVVVGSQPVRTHTTRHADSAEHLQYSKILTAADPPGTAPYSWVQIGADRRKEIERVRDQRQTPQYKLQKRNSQIYNKVYGMRAAMKHLPPRRFWDDWTATVSIYIYKENLSICSKVLR
jgi:hypothetical protein